MPVPDIDIGKRLQLFVVKIVVFVIDAHRRHADAMSGAQGNIRILKDPRLGGGGAKEIARLQINVRLFFTLANGGTGENGCRGVGAGC